jgi:hypothetical protein
MASDPQGFEAFFMAPVRTSTMEIIRKSSFSASPWKNGGGVTHEAIRVPPGVEAFRWRVSVAEIHQGGPFSDFVGYRRFMVLLRGDGVRLTCNGRDHAELRQPGDMTQFDGAAATACSLLGGPCTDLNLMVSQAIPGARASTERVNKPYAVDPGDGMAIVFAIRGDVSVDTAGGASAVLAEGDLALITSRDAAVLSPGSGAAGGTAGPESAPLVFLAALDDNSVPIS